MLLVALVTLPWPVQFKKLFKKCLNIKISLLFQQFWGGYIKELKEEGRNDTSHNKEIPPASLIEIIMMLSLLQQIMECDKSRHLEYQSLIQKLPQDYKNTYHRLIQYGAMFIVCMHTARRGREGIGKLIF